MNRKNVANWLTTRHRVAARGIGKHDHDAKEKIRLAVYSGQDGKAAKLATRMDVRVAQAQAQLASLRVEKRYEGDLWFDCAPSRRKTVLHLESREIACGSQRMLAVPDLYIGNTDHVGIVGPNGAGKSTLVRHMMRVFSAEGEKDGEGALAEGLPLDGAWCQIRGGVRTLFVGQEIPARRACEMVQSIRQLPPAQRGRLLSVVAQLDSDPDRILAGNGVSPGELRKLVLAQGILQAPELIVLDEPTNHLDIHSVEALERALAAFPGALVLVSHDEAFLQAATTKRLHLCAGPIQTRCTLEW